MGARLRRAAFPFAARLRPAFSFIFCFVARLRRAISPYPFYFSVGAPAAHHFSLRFPLGPLDSPCPQVHLKFFGGFQDWSEVGGGPRPIPDV